MDRVACRRAGTFRCDEHTSNELIKAASVYLGIVGFEERYHGLVHDPKYPGMVGWPWDVSWWKPSDSPIRNLVKAGALIAAEIDRLQRATVPS